MRRRLRNPGWLAGSSLILPLVLAVFQPSVWASTHRMTEFHHSMWTSDNGLGAVFDIQQASDGYLWLTTSTGVFRFDGVRFQSVEEVTNGAVQNSQIHSAFLSSSGGVWLKTRAAGLLYWKDGRLSVFPDRRCTPALQLEGLAEDRDGSLWVQGSSGFFHLRGSACEEVGAEQGYPGGFPAAILIDRKGTVWVRTLAGDILFRPQGQSGFQHLRYSAGAISAAFVLATPTHYAFLHEGPDGSIWLSDDYGIRRVTDKTGAPISRYLPPKVHKENIQFGDFAFAADGSLWVVTDRGVRRFEQVEQWRVPQALEDSPSESFTTEQGLSSNAAWKVLIDREGSVWVGTNSGLDQLRHSTLTALVIPPTEEHDFAIAAGDRESVWTGNRSMPPALVAADGTVKIFQEPRGTICLRRDRNGSIWSAGGGDGKLWRISGAGFTSLQFTEDKVGPVISLAVDRNDDVWISTAIGGIYHLSHGEWSRQNEVLGRKPGIIGAMAGDDAGNVWFGFSNYVVRWNGNDYQSFSFPNGSRGVSESTMSVRGDHVWLGGSGGIELFTQGHFYLLNWKDPDLPGRVSGVLETKKGELWANGSSGITHVSATELTRWLHDKTSTISAERLNAQDGLPGFSAERIPEPSIAESSQGRLWFATTKGIAWLDPAKLEESRNRLPPPVMISSIFANGKTYVGTNSLTFPAHTEKLEIDYTALSLAIPERVLFRYILESFDNEWQDAGTRRQAFYTSLPPGRYHFRVIACNNDGVWNESSAVLSFAIAPAFYQTWWFRSFSLTAFLGLLYILYRLRLQQVARQFHMRLEERVGERTRIARDLHDTLLQSFQAVLLKFHAVTYLLDRPAEARKALESTIESAREAITEGRDAVQGLRASTLPANDLAKAISLLGEELVADPLDGHSPEFCVQVEGQSRILAPIVRDEVYRIAGEALRNAFRHANAGRIEVEIHYGPGQFRLKVTDNGKGIDPRIREAGSRDGHFGLSGMDERARQIGGKMNLWSEIDSGTEAELTIPAAIAYARSENSRRSVFSRKGA